MSACSNRPSITLIKPVKIKTEVLRPVPSIEATTECSALDNYTSEDENEVVEVTVRNIKKYYVCSSKMKAAILYINTVLTMPES